MKLRRLAALGLAGLMTMSMVSIAPAAEDDEVVTIKFMHKGPKPDNWDAVYAKYEEEYLPEVGVALDVTWVEHADYKEKLNLEITSGNDWDLVFDAAWVQLKNLAAEHYYADLSSYFNNPEEYPGLAKAFTEDMMNANIWFGDMCYIPLLETYGNGIPVLWYRKDLAKEWGIGEEGQITSYDEMEAYWQAALDAGMIPYGCTQARGCFQQLSIRGEVDRRAADALDPALPERALRLVDDGVSHPPLSMPEVQDEVSVPDDGIHVAAADAGRADELGEEEDEEDGGHQDLFEQPLPFPVAKLPEPLPFLFPRTDHSSPSSLILQKTTVLSSFPSPAQVDRSKSRSSGAQSTSLAPLSNSVSLSSTRSRSSRSS